MDPRVSFATVCDAFERQHVAVLRPNTREGYRTALRRLRTAFDGKRMVSITKADVRALVASWRAEGLKASTVNNYLAKLSAVFTFARDDLDMPVSVPRLKRGERPRAEDDAREHRILTDTELEQTLAALGGRHRLFFRFLAETGCRKSEALGLTPRRVAVELATVTFHEQLDHDGDLAPLKTKTSRRTIEITRALAAELALAAGHRRVFEPLTHDMADKAWQHARRGLAEPVPVLHDLRHTHVSGLIADGWDPVEVAGRIGDTLATTLRVYAHEFDARRRSQERRAALENRYGSPTTRYDVAQGMATRGPSSSDFALPAGEREVADLQAIRDKGR